MEKTYKQIDFKRLPQSEIEVKISVQKETLEKHFKKALEKYGKEVEIPGFRKGKVPVETLRGKFGDMYFLNHAAEDAIEEIYEQILKEEKISPVGSPKITITKLALDNPLEFTMVIAVIPNIDLPDYKKIAKEVLTEKSDDSTVTEKEIDEVVLEIRKNHYHQKMHESGAWTDHNHGEIEEKDIPPLTDELSKGFGKFENVKDMRKKIKEHLYQEKTRKLKEKKRVDIIEKIIERSDIDTPRVLIENELDMMLAQFEGDLARAGGTLDAYLETIKKSTEDLRDEWRDIALKKAKSQLIISKIASQEKIFADSETIRKEAEKILILYPDADPIKARSYVALMLTNEKVFELLESLGEKSTAIKAEKK